MGWLFGYHTRRELIDHLVSGNGIKTLKHCCKGNNLWAVHEYVRTGDTEPTRYVALYLLRGGKHGDMWGYKDMDESMHPYYYNCPLSYLDGLSEPTGSAAEWRENVRKYHTRRSRKLYVGDMFRLYGLEYKVRMDNGTYGYTVERSSGYSQGDTFRLRRARMFDVVILERADSIAHPPHITDNPFREEEPLTNPLSDIAKEKYNEQLEA